MPWEDWGLNCSGVLAWLEATTFLKPSRYLFSRNLVIVLPIVHCSAPVDLPDDVGLPLNLLVFPAVHGLPSSILDLSSLRDSSSTLV